MRALSNTVVDRVRSSGSITFVARFRGNVVTCSIDMDGWIICMCTIDSEVSTGSELREVVSGDIELGRPK